MENNNQLLRKIEQNTRNENNGGGGSVELPFHLVKTIFIDKLYIDEQMSGEFYSICYDGNEDRVSESVASYYFIVPKSYKYIYDSDGRRAELVDGKVEYEDYDFVEYGGGISSN